MRLKVFILIFFLLAMGLLKASAAAPPAENILVIYYADTTQSCADGHVQSGSTVPPSPDLYGTALMSAVTTALTPLAATITLLPIYNTDYGIYGQLNSVLHLTNLNSFCQVWDLRFMDYCSNPSSMPDPEADIVTNSGLNNDTQLYESFVAQGGSLFLQGEHHDFYARNLNLLELINAMALTPMSNPSATACGPYGACADVNVTCPGGITITNNFTTNYNFNNIYDVIPGAGESIVGLCVGGIPSADYGSGLPLLTVPGLFYAGSSGGMLMGWIGNSALSPTYALGKVIASFETNAWATPAFDSVWSQDAIQNSYAELSGCQRYNVTKSFSPTSICVGSMGNFTIVANNTSPNVPLTNYSVSDTIPTCLTFSSSSPAPTGNTTNLYWWTFPTISPGASVSVTVTYTASSFPPCP